MGRRCKLSPELSEEICLLIRKGCPVEVACRAIGIARSTYYGWLAQGEAEEASRQEAADQGPEWTTTSQAADLTGLSVAELRKAARAGEFKAKKQRGRWFLDRASLLLWVAPEGSPYLQFLEAVRQAEAEAEAHLVEFWQEQTPKDWRAARDLLARRFPERWSERRLIEADVRSSSQIQADVAISGEVEVEVEVSRSEVREMLQRFRDFLMGEAVDFEQARMDIQSLLSDGLPRLPAEITSATGWAGEKLDRALEAMLRGGQVEKEGDLWISTWTAPEVTDDDDQGEELPTSGPSPEPDWIPKPSKVAINRAPIVRGKLLIASVQDGDEL